MPTTQSFDCPLSSVDTFTNLEFQRTETIDIAFDRWSNENKVNNTDDERSPSRLGTLHLLQADIVDATTDNFSAFPAPQKPASAVLRNRGDCDIFQLTRPRFDADRRGGYAVQAVNRFNHDPPVTSSLRPAQTTPRLCKNYDTISSPFISSEQAALGSVTGTEHFLPLAISIVQSRPDFTTFPPIPVVVGHDLSQPALEQSRPEPMPSEPASVEQYRHISESIPLFLSDGAEKYWEAFGPTDPVAIGNVLLRSQGSSKWLMICFSLANPYAYELMQQLDLLAGEIALVFSRSASCHKSVFKPDYDDLPQYRSNWQSRFERFTNDWQSDTWDSRVDKLYLLNDEYQATTNKLYEHWKSLQFVPTCVWIKLRKLDILRRVLQEEMPDLPNHVGLVKTWRKDEERRHLERAQLQLPEPTAPINMSAKTSKTPWRWNTCMGKRSSKPYRRSRTTMQSLKYQFYDSLEDCKEEIPRFFSLLGHMNTYGTQRAAYVIVSVLSALATATMALSVWRCPPTAALSIAVTIDSNFWSTCSQMFTGLGGLYCLIIPILQHTGLDVSMPRLFKALLVLSFAAAVVAVLVYHFQTQVSLIVALISGLAGLLATLMLIKDAGNKINVQKNTIVDQAFKVSDLEDQISRLRNP